MSHFSVLREEAVDALAIKNTGKYIDCTFGRGGHSKEILRNLDDSGMLLAFDRDLAAIHSETAACLLTDQRFELRQACFSKLHEVAAVMGWLGKTDGILMDLGVSSPQLDDPERGFSFMRDGPLDMRMDNSVGKTAAEWLVQVQEKELIQVLFDYGEERFARRIAEAVLRQRDIEPITTTGQLVTLIEKSIPFREKNKHPATRSFQAIRIAINHELEELQMALQQTLAVLKPGGRLVVISFHSLEDRIVKRFIRDESRGKYTPGKLPSREQHEFRPRVQKIGKTVRAAKDEMEKNPRSRSAIMRVAESTCEIK